MVQLLRHDGGIRQQSSAFGHGAGAIPAAFTKTEFVDLVCLLVERGFLLNSEMEHP